MNAEAQAGVIFIFGAVALRLGLTDAHLAYIQPAMGPPLAVAGAVLALLGGAILLRPAPGGRGGSDGHGDDHEGGSRVGWLLLAPILAVAVVAPSPLGAFAADRAPAALPAPKDFGPLPAPTAGAVDLPLTDFVGRALHGRGQSLRDIPVRLVGFTGSGAGGEELALTRFVISCCAADARPVRVTLGGVASPWPPPDTWVEATGIWRAEARSAEDARPPTLDVASLRTIPPPENRYLR